MKTISARLRGANVQFLERQKHSFFGAVPSRWLQISLTGLLFCSAAAAPIGRTFNSPEEAVSALAAATKVQDRQAILDIFGPGADELVNPDRVQGENELAAFTMALAESKRIVRNSATQCELEVGSSAWPFPIPIVQKDGRWFFDTEAGKEEMLNRRIGRNEMFTLEVMRAYVDAQREYASRDRDGDEVLEYAQRVLSSPGQKDGLHWPLSLDGSLSPFGPLVALAHLEGYGQKEDAADNSVQPYHGYYFKVLNRQGGHAPGGKYDYIINGHMIAGFALLAYPADYGESGIMTFVVNQQGKVYQKDLGAKTAEIAKQMTEYDPDASWHVSPD